MHFLLESNVFKSGEINVSMKSGNITECFYDLMFKNEFVNLYLFEIPQKT